MGNTIQPYSYYNVINPSAPSLQSGGVYAATAASTSGNNAASTSTNTNSTAGVSGKPTLSKDVIAVLQQAVKDTGAGDVTSLINGGTNSDVGALIGGTKQTTSDSVSLANFYNSLIQGAYQGASIKSAERAASTSNIQNIIDSYYKAINVAPASTTTVDA